MRRDSWLSIITAPLWLPALAVVALVAYVAGWIDWMARKR